MIRYWLMLVKYGYRDGYSPDRLFANVDDAEKAAREYKKRNQSDGVVICPVKMDPFACIRIELEPVVTAEEMGEPAAIVG